MKNLIIVLFAITVLSSCGTTGLTSESASTNYWMCSKGEAGLIYSIFSGDVSFIKITEKSDWNITEHLSDEQLTEIIKECIKK